MTRILLSLLIISILYSLYLIYPLYEANKLSDMIVKNASPYEQHPANPNKSILVAGDSTAAGIGAVDPKNSIAGRLGQQFPNADITNLGVNGARLKDLLAILRKQDRHYDLIVLQIGANDITHFTPYDTVRHELDDILTLSNKLSPKIILLTSGNIGTAPVFRWPLSSIMTHRTQEVRSIFMDEASKYKSVSYIDLFKSHQDDHQSKYIQSHYAPDGFHLSDEGYGLWYYQIQKAL